MQLGDPDLDLIVTLAALGPQPPHVLVAVDKIADEAERTAGKY